MLDVIRRRLKPSPPPVRAGAGTPPRLARGTDLSPGRRVGLLGLCAGMALLAAGCAEAASHHRATQARPAVHHPADPTTPDEAFYALREAARNGDAARAEALAQRLGGYGEPAYVDYFRLRPRIYDSGGNVRADAPDAEIIAFLARHDGSAIADRLRNDWLLVLGKRHDWARFDAEYPRYIVNDDTQVKCYAQMSRLAGGREAPAAVAADAIALLIEPKYYGDACIDLIGALAQAGQITREQIRTQARWALEQNLNTLARRIATVTGDDRADADSLALVVKAARNDPASAATMLRGLAAGMSGDEQGAAWGVIGAFYARKLAPEAIDAFRRQQSLGGEALLSPETREWKVRAALLAGDWPMVQKAVDAMPDAVRRRDPAWTYWHGRALRAQGNLAGANADFQALAPQFHFYAQLAREDLGQRIMVPARTPVADADVGAMSARSGFARAQRFYALNMRFEGMREWNWELRGMSDRELLAAAEYARRINLLDRTVSTADRTRAEHDFELRYITPFRDLMRATTERIGLDLAWAYGLIRQESRFMMNARSSVGASGLMQVMPSTARYVARKIGMADYVPGKLEDMGTNILLGTSYLNMVLADVDGSQALASAAYNAGPARSKSWRALLARPVEGAIFAEAIPFNETRTYVKNVLANATLYAAILSGQPQSLRARLGLVAPKSVITTGLP